MLYVSQMKVLTYLHWMPMEGSWVGEDGWARMRSCCAAEGLPGWEEPEAEGWSCKKAEEQSLGFGRSLLGLVGPPEKGRKEFYDAKHGL